MRILILFMAMCVMFAGTPAKAGQPQAQAEEKVEVPSWLSFKGPGKKDLSNSHRSANEITKYAEFVVVDAMTFGVRELSDNLSNKRGYFTDKGFVTYNKFLSDSNFTSILARKKQKITSIVMGEIKILRRGTVEDKYRWLVRVPLIMSFFKDDVMTPEENENSGALSNAKVDVIIQFVRVPSDVHHRELLVENWSVKKGKGL